MGAKTWVRSPKVRLNTMTLVPPKDGSSDISGPVKKVTFVWGLRQGEGSPGSSLLSWLRRLGREFRTRRVGSVSGWSTTSRGASR